MLRKQITVSLHNEICGCDHIVPPSDSSQERTVSNDCHTHFMNCDGPWLVAVATGGFICVPEQEVNEVHPTVHLERRTTLSDGFELKLFQSFLEKSCIVIIIISFYLYGAFKKQFTKCFDSQ